jgi:mannosyl-3-phosphoglycerate phosphatase family protein
VSVVYLVFTDLDGSLLDHDTYRYDAAVPVLELLESLRIPVIMVSSKTRVEILALREELANEHPFIVENGAAVMIPENYFIRAPESCELRDGFWVRSFSPPRESWSAPLAALHAALPGCFEDFASAGAEGVARMTGLPLEKAGLANKREYSEPVQWRGSDEELDYFLHELAGAGATVMRGGRFYSVGGDCDKGRALRWLRDQYRLAAGASSVYDLAIGDGQNDAPMLDAAHRALLIPAHGRALPQLSRKDGVLVGEGVGPQAWAAGVQAWLHELYSDSTQTDD